jgi:hypothetical protein
MNQHVRDALRQAGAEAGWRARREAGLPERVEDHQTVQRMAELLIKSGGDRTFTASKRWRRRAAS